MRNIKVMITGADDDVDPRVLHALSLKYPFVEWGILMSANTQTRLRYPSAEWRKELENLESRVADLHLVAHLCGALARHQRPSALPRYAAVQVNLNGFLHPTEDDFCRWVSQFHVPVILQCPTMAHAVHADLSFLSRYGTLPKRPHYLIDASGGVGRYDPTFWGAPHEALRCVGYAGGIGPHNVEQVLDIVWTRVHEHPCTTSWGKLWIDMESGVRTDDCFDLDKVNDVLARAALWRAA